MVSLSSTYILWNIRAVKKRASFISSQFKQRVVSLAMRVGCFFELKKHIYVQRTHSTALWLRTYFMCSTLFDYRLFSPHFFAPFLFSLRYITQTFPFPSVFFSLHRCRWHNAFIWDYVEFEWLQMRYAHRYYCYFHHVNK